MQADLAIDHQGNQRFQNMFSQSRLGFTICLVAASFSQSLLAHSGNANDVAWQACEAKAASDQCSFQNANEDTYRGTCQLMSDSLMCVRNQPIERNTAASGNGNSVESEAGQLHYLEHLFAGAKVVEGPSMVDCTLSGGTSARCFSITVKAEPSDYTPGPWCPEHITDGPMAGGIWLESGAVHNVDGAFIKNLSGFYNDKQWQLFDAETGKIKITDTIESCAAAARPDVDPAYQNYCVQCLPEYMNEDASVTYTIPIKPYPITGKTQSTRASGSGIAFNGVRLDGPAPVKDILSNYTVAPFDDCGGHVNLHVGYHYHAATDCLVQSGHSNSHGTVIGLAMDGRQIFARLTNTKEVPDDLDACGGHVLEGGEYHYHAGEQGSNAILNCMTAEVGCVSESMNEPCNANNAGAGGGGGGGAKGPDLSAAARALGVSESDLLEALGGPPPDFERAAATLNVDIDVLRKALPKPGR